MEEYLKLKEEAGRQGTALQMQLDKVTIYMYIVCPSKHLLRAVCLISIQLSHLVFDSAEGLA